MNHTSCTTLRVVADTPLTRPITVELPLATIEELDHHAMLQHLDRGELLAEIIDVALMNEPPHRPTGQGAATRLAVRARLTHARTIELAGRAG